MTAEELAKLTPEQKRIRIAELCGWTEGKPFNNAFDGTPTRQWNSPNAGSYVLWELPDYLSDLNAMHEAEKRLPFLECFKYRDRLHDLANPKNEAAIRFTMFGAGTTATQRADAFLLTLA